MGTHPIFDIYMRKQRINGLLMDTCRENGCFHISCPIEIWDVSLFSPLFFPLILLLFKEVVRFFHRSFFMDDYT
jgi:hypothetical protein